MPPISDPSEGSTPPAGGYDENNLATDRVESERQAHLQRLRWDPDALAQRFNTSLATYRQHQARGILDLQQAAVLLREIRTLTSGNYPSLDQGYEQLANAFFEMFVRYSGSAALEESIQLNLEALQLRPDSHSKRATTLANLGSCLRAKSEHASDQKYLDFSIQILLKALTLQPQDHIERPDTLIRLVGALHDRFTHTDDIAVLDDMERHLGEASHLILDSHPLRVRLAADLAATSRCRYLRSGDLTALDRAINQYRRVLIICPDDHPDRGDYMTALAVALDDLFLCTGDLRSLDEALETYRRALKLLPTQGAGYPDALDNLGASLTHKFKRTGDLSALDEAFSCHEGALRQNEEIGANCSGSLTNLALTYDERFLYTGDPEFLDRAISLQIRALEVRGENHPALRHFKGHLGGFLTHRYELTGELLVLDEAVDVLKTALDLFPVGHCGRAIPLGNLGNLLEAQYRRLGYSTSLEDAIGFHREAIELRPEGHVQRDSSLNSLAICLHERFKGNTEDVAVLQEAIGLHQAALALRPAGHRYRTTTLNNLANALSDLYLTDKEQHPLVIEEAIGYLKEAVESCSENAAERSSLLNGLGNAIRLGSERSDGASGWKESAGRYEEALQLRQIGHPLRWETLLNLSAVYSLKNSPYFDPHVAIKLLDQATTDAYGGPWDRFYRSSDRLTKITWIRSFDGPESLRIALLGVYRHLIQLMPRIAYFGLDLRERLHSLYGSEKVGADAAMHALALKQPATAVELLEESRAVFWFQALRVRSGSSPLEGLPADIVDELLHLFQALEAGSFCIASATARPWRDQAIITRRQQSDKAEQLIDGIRLIPGQERFLSARPFAQLAEAAAKGPVVILVAHQQGCDAIVLLDETGALESIPLPDLDVKALHNMGEYVRHSNVRGGGQSAQEQDKRGIKKASVSAKNQKTSLPVKSLPAVPTTGDLDGEEVLKQLWYNVVKPVLTCDALNVKEGRGRERRRLFWCPTGPFAFLPLHAAGRCSDYVVSSYTPTLTALIEARRGWKPSRIADVKSLLVSEPYAPNMRPIEYVIDEIAAVGRHLVATSATIVGDSTLSKRESGSTRQAVLERISNVSILHMACHGEQDKDNPLQSGFCLRDGRLTVEDLMRLKLTSSFFAFLSACESAMGDRKQPDQAVHLAAAMLFVGFRSIVATMWAIGDADAVMIAGAFYEQLLKTDTLDMDAVPFALDKAVEKLRHLRVPTHRWAPFIHLGA